jgi:hypothetical protein
MLVLQPTDNPLTASDSDDTVTPTARRTTALRVTLRVLYQPLRTLIGFFQVLTHLGPVLHLDFPPGVTAVMDALRPFAADLQALVRLGCLANLGFYGAWVVQTLVVPLLAGGCLVLWWLHERRAVGVEAAGRRLRANTFVLVFLIYPGVSNRAFGVFNCRQLSPDLAVLEDDYSVDCGTMGHAAFEALAMLVALGFSVGVPTALIVLMVWRVHQDPANTDADRFVARRLAEELKVADDEALDTLRDVRLGTEYFFMVSSYRSSYFYFEAVDMLRKLALVGMLVIAGRGSNSKLFVGLLISVTSLVVQVRLTPLKHWEDNQLKAVTEVAIFLTLLTGLMVAAARRADSQEYLSVSMYDTVLVVVLVGVLPTAFLATLLYKRRRVREALQSTGDAASDVEQMKQTLALENSPSGERRRVFRLFQLGIASVAEMQVLVDYVDKVESLVNTNTHVFISYRSGVDAWFARQLYEELSARMLEATGQRMRIYLDQVRLEDGQRWDQGFMGGLASSMVFVPIVSVGALQPMLTLGADGGDDSPDYMCATKRLTASAPCLMFMVTLRVLLQRPLASACWWSGWLHLSCSNEGR